MFFGNKKNVCLFFYLPSIPMRISSTQGNIRIISKLGNGMWRKKPMRISKPSSLQMSRIVLAAKEPFIHYVKHLWGSYIEKKMGYFLKIGRLSSKLMFFNAKKSWRFRWQQISSYFSASINILSGYAISNLCIQNWMNYKK